MKEHVIKGKRKLTSKSTEMNKNSRVKKIRSYQAHKLIM